MEVKVVRCCVPLCLLSLGNRFTIEKSALSTKLWCVQCQIFFPLTPSYLLSLEIMFNLIRCRMRVRGKRVEWKRVTLVSCHRLGTACVCNQRLPWCSLWLLGRGLLRLAGWVWPQQLSSPRCLRLELAEEQTGMLLGAPVWPWSGTKVLGRWVGSFPSVCSPEQSSG